MSTHDFMKATSVMPFEAVRQAVLNRHNDGALNKRSSFRRRISLRSLSADEGKDAIQRVDIENLTTKSNHIITSRRFYVDSSQSPHYNGIGWILHDGVTNCMFCGHYFGALQAKHNCSACGLVACANCSSNYAFIAELNDKKKHRVCKNCKREEGETITAMDKYKRAPRGTVSESINPLPPPTTFPTKQNDSSTSPISSPSCYNDETGSQYTESLSGDNANLHFTFMKNLTCKPLHEVKLEFSLAQGGHAIQHQQRASFMRQNSPKTIYVVSDLIEELVKLPDNSSTPVFRVFVASSTGGRYAELGWIVKDEATNCMECFKTFGALRGKYHCKACGDLVCSACSRYKRKIAELGTQATHRVCGRCHNSEQIDGVLNIRRPRPTLARRWTSFSRSRQGSFHFSSSMDVTVVDAGGCENIDNGNDNPLSVPLENAEIVAPVVYENELDNSLNVLTRSHDAANEIVGDGENMHKESSTFQSVCQPEVSISATSFEESVWLSKVSFSTNEKSQRPDIDASKVIMDPKMEHVVPDVESSEQSMPSFAETPASNVFCYFLF